MGAILLIGRLAARDLRGRPGPAVLLLLAITAATTVLTLGLALHGVTSRPYEQTRAATAGPDVVAELTGPGPAGRLSRPQLRTQAASLARLARVTGSSGPYPVASAIVAAHGIRAGVEAEGRGPMPALVDQPKLTQGRWVRPGGVVIERTFARALGVGVGGRVTLNGRPFTVTGIAVTAASPPYPNLCSTGCTFSLPGTRLAGTRLNPGEIGLAWVTEPEARALATPASPLSYVMNLRLRDPGRAPALTAAYARAHPARSAPLLIPWQGIRSADALLVQDEQQILTPGSWLAGLLALASVAVLAGGRMAEQTRRVGLLKAVGGTPATVAAVLLAENLSLALAAAAAGLTAGWLAAPLLTSPGAGLVGTPGAPSLTGSTAALVTAVALAVALLATAPPAIRAARTSTVSALADAARPPRRRATLIRLSARLPVALLLALRLAARRPRRATLSAASIAVTVAAVVAVLAYRADIGQHSSGAPGGLSNPVADRDGQILLVLTVVLVALSALNAILTAWATVADSRHTTALSRALGASPRQVSAGLSAAQVLPALPGAILGVPLGIALFATTNGAGTVIIPPSWWLGAAVLGTVLAVAGLTSIPARMGARHPVTEILRSETA